ncbi:MAG TPA: LamG domain-containing protein [Anaeromyxobacter sp.]|nr:LamG domain-containing protein [Anaeromyxobacter sp.]
MIRPVSTAVALALSLPLAAAAQVRPADLHRGAIAAYALDGDAVDAITRFRATPVATRPVEDRHGQRNGALWFDGVRSAVNLGSALQPARFTVAAWVRPEASDRVMVILSKIRNLPGHYQRNLELRLDPGGRVFLHVPSGQGWEAVTGTRPVPAGRWTHVAATYDGARAQLFVDGARDGQPFAVRYEQSQTDTWIGARPESGGADGRTPTGPTFFFLGAIDDVRVWDRPLADPELAAVAARGVPAPPAGPPPVAGPGPRQAVPVAIYPLDGDAREALGGADGALVGTRPAADRAGNPRGALAMTGKDHVDLGVRTEPERFSLALWVRPTRAGREQVIFSKLSTRAQARERWLELRLDALGRVVLKVPNDSAFDSSAATAEKLPSGRWTHVAATFDGERAALYLDGALAGEARVLPFEPSRGPAFLGARPDVQGRRARMAPLLDGRVDDLRIFRGALSPDEVFVLARMEERPPVPPGRGDDDEASDVLLLAVDRSLLRYDAACVRGDAQKLAKVEERIAEDLENGLRAARADRETVDRVRYVVRELQSGRGRHDPMSLDRKRSALHGLSEALWNDLAREMDDQPRPYPASDHQPYDDPSGGDRW